VGGAANSNSGYKAANSNVCPFPVFPPTHALPSPADGRAMSSPPDAAESGQSVGSSETPDAPDDEQHSEAADASVDGPAQAACIAGQLTQEEAQERLLAFPDADRELWRTIAQDPRQESLPALNADQLLRGLGVLMNRMSHTEEARRRDRLVINELRGEVQNLKRKLTEVDGVLTSASQNALYCKDAPHFEGLRMHEPRTMSIPELKLLQESCERLRDNDKRLPEVARITGIVPSAQGEISFDISHLSATKQWQLYYYLIHKRVVRKANPTKRGKSRLPELAQSTGATSSSVEPWPEQSNDESNDESGRASECAWDDGSGGEDGGEDGGDFGDFGDFGDE
jgi:hypothetical protein